MRIVTHNAKFHTDDVFAVATLLILYPDAEIIRTRDEDLVKVADIAVDVGQVYDAKNNRFDHHQAGGAGERANGIQYASAGLVWKKFGEKVSGSREVAEKIDRAIIQLVDAADNGQDVILSTIPEVFPFTINGVVDQYRATWKEEECWDEQFVEVLYHNSANKKIIRNDEKYDFGRELVMSVLVKYPKPIYAILYRGDTQSWQILSIKKNITTFESRKALPAVWRAKRDAEFEAISKVPGALYCHRSGFMCTVKSRESAIKLAKIALDA